MISDNLLNMVDGDNIIVICPSQERLILSAVKFDFSQNISSFICSKELDIKNLMSDKDIAGNVISSIIEIEVEYKIRIKGAIVTIANSFIDSSTYKVKIEEKKIHKFTKFDVIKMFENTIKRHFKEKPNNFILDIRNSQYILDKRVSDSNPIGIEGHLIEANMSVFSMENNVFTKFLKDLQKYNINIIDCVPTIFGINENYKDAQSKDMIIQIESNETSLLISQKGCPTAILSIPIGLDNIYSVIEKKFFLSKVQSERALKSYSDISIGINGNSKNAFTDDILSRPYDDYIINIDQNSISYVELSQVSRQEVKRIFAKIKLAIEENNIDLEVKNILISGSGSQITGIADLCRNEFSIRSELDNIYIDAFNIQDTTNRASKDIFWYSGISKYVIEKNRRLKSVFKKDLFSFLPKKVSCFLHEIF